MSLKANARADGMGRYGPSNASRYSYDDGHAIFKKLGYAEGFDGYCFVFDGAKELFEDIPLAKKYSWKEMSKAFRYGCHMGYQEGWREGYLAACENELWLYDTIWQLRGEPPVALMPARNTPWTEEFHYCPPIRPMAVPSFMKTVDVQKDVS
jgi:hypothetical protein